MTFHAQKLMLPVGAFVLALPILLSAQQIPGVGNPINLSVSPTYPTPNSTIAVRAESFALDLDRSFLTWRVDGAVAKQGRGLKTIEAQVGESGAVTTVSLTADSDEGVFTETLTLRPALIDLVWESGSYTPPLYRGKALPGSEAPLRITALPSIPGEDPSELIYTWEVGNRVQGSLSGRGRNTLELTGPRLFGTTRVRVTVENDFQTLTARGETVVQATEPRVLLYKNDPLLGIQYERALAGSFELSEEEITVTAHPFFFNGSSRADASNSYTWELNGNTVENPSSDKSSLLLRQTGEGSGSALLSLSVDNMDELLQRARTQAQLMFGGGRERPAF